MFFGDGKTVSTLTKNTVLNERFPHRADLRGFRPCNSAVLQQPLFVEPHGTIFSKSGFKDEKIQLHETIKDLEKKLNEKKEGTRITLDSFIVSVTEKQSVGGVFDYPADSVYDENHVLFQEDERYIRKMLDAVLP